MAAPVKQTGTRRPYVTNFKENKSFSKTKGTTMPCEHLNFHCASVVYRLEDSGRFVLSVKVHCTDCGEKFYFRNLPPGLNTDGVSCSVDAQEASLAIQPVGKEPKPFDGISGYSINFSKGN